MCLWLSWSLTLKSSMSYWREHRRVGQIGRILLRPTVTPWSFTNLYPNTPLSHCITTVRNVSTEKENKKTFTASRNIDLRLVHPNQQFTSIHLVSFKNSFSLSISLSLSLHRHSRTVPMCLLLLINPLWLEMLGGQIICLICQGAWAPRCFRPRAGWDQDSPRASPTPLSTVKNTGLCWRKIGHPLIM